MKYVLLQYYDLVGTMQLWQFVYALTIMLAVCMLALALVMSIGRSDLHYLPVSVQTLACLGIFLVTPQVGLPVFLGLCWFIMPACGSPTSASIIASSWVLACWLFTAYSMCPKSKHV